MTHAGAVRRWRRLLTVVRLGLAAAIIGALLRYGIIDPSALLKLLSDPGTALPAGSMLTAAFLLGGVRWFLILRALRLPVSFRESFRLYSIGAFFNTFLPGGTGGDVVRGIYLVRGIESRRVRAMSSVVADRVAGLYGMLIVAVVLVHANAAVVLSHASTAALSSVLYLVFVTMTLAAAAALLAARPISNSRRVRSWLERGPILQIANRLFESLAALRGEIRVLAVSTGISVLISALLIASIVMLASAGGSNTPTLLDYSCAAVLALLAGAIPLTPGGIGVAEGAFAHLCLLWSGVPAAYATIFLGYRLLAALISLVGAVAFVVHRRPESATSGR